LSSIQFLFILLHFNPLFLYDWWFDHKQTNTEEFLRSRFLFVILSQDTVQKFVRNQSFADSRSIEFVWFDKVQFVRSKPCFALLASLLLYKLNSYSESLSSIQNSVQIQLGASIQKDEPGLYKYLTSKNHDSCPFLKSFRSLLSLLIAFPLFGPPIYCGLLWILESVKFLKSCLVSPSFWPLFLMLTILLGLISWQSKVDEVEASLSVCIHDSKPCVIKCDNYQG